MVLCLYLNMHVIQRYIHFLSINQHLSIACFLAQLQDCAISFTQMLSIYTCFVFFVGRKSNIHHPPGVNGEFLSNCASKNHFRWTVKFVESYCILQRGQKAIHYSKLCVFSSCYVTIFSDFPEKPKIWFANFLLRLLNDSSAVGVPFYHVMILCIILPAGRESL